MNGPKDQEAKTWILAFADQRSSLHLITNSAEMSGLKQSWCDQFRLWSGTSRRSFFHVTGTLTSKWPFSLVKVLKTARSRAAGPSITFPFGLKVDPWHLQENDPSVSEDSLHFRCVQSAESAKSSLPLRMTKNP
jgi:hypothetical protein